MLIRGVAIVNESHVETTPGFGFDLGLGLKTWLSEGQGRISSAVLGSSRLVTRVGPTVIKG